MPDFDFSYGFAMGGSVTPRPKKRTAFEDKLLRAEIDVMLDHSAVEYEHRRRQYYERWDVYGPIVTSRVRFTQEMMRVIP